MNQISISSSTIARALALVAFLLVLASIAGDFSTFVLGHNYLKGLVPLFNLNGEKNIPAYFSMLLMIVASLLLAVITILHAKRKDSHISKWGVLCFVFLYMSFDEAFSVHERWSSWIKPLIRDEELGVFYHAWVIPAMILVLVLGLYFSRFLLNLTAKTRFRFLMAATLYLGGAIGFELIGGRYFEKHGPTVDWVYSVLMTCEETLEIAGLIVFIWALLRYFAEHFQNVQWRFQA